MLIDCGFDLPVSAEYVLAACAELRIPVNDLVYLVTHQHPDHSGAVTRLCSSNSTVYSHSGKDGSSLKTGSSFSHARAAAIEFFCSFESVEINTTDTSSFLGKHLFWSAPQQGYSQINDGDILCFSDYEFQCIETPGHDDTHICLYEENRGILISGDHVLERISPAIMEYVQGSKCVSAYIKSLEKVRNLSVKKILPGHGAMFSDLSGRCKELKLHHEKRLDEILGLVQSGYSSVYDISRHCKWRTRNVSWDNLSCNSRFSAYSETYAHLVFLMDEGLIKEETKNIFTIK